MKLAAFMNTVACVRNYEEKNASKTSFIRSRDHVAMEMIPKRPTCKYIEGKFVEARGNTPSIYRFHSLQQSGVIFQNG